MSNKLHVKKGDTVKVIAGSHKGKTGAVVKTSPREQLIFVDGIGLVKRKVKPSQLNPRGGAKEIHIGLAAGKIALVADDKKRSVKTVKKARVTKKTGKES